MFEKKKEKINRPKRPELYHVRLQPKKEYKDIVIRAANRDEAVKKALAKNKDMELVSFRFIINE